MATDEKTIDSLEFCNEVLKALFEIPAKYLPTELQMIMEELQLNDRYSGTLPKGHRYTLSMHIGQQRRQIGWKLRDGKWIRGDMK